MKNRPPKRRKPDALLAPDMKAIEAQCHAAIAPLDRLALKMDAKWGVDRLVELVTPDTAARYGSAIGRLNEALRERNAEQCLHMAKVCMRGLAAMDAEAEAANAPRPKLLAEIEVDGFHFGLLAETGDWAAVKAERPDLRVFSMREVAIALKSVAGAPVVAAIKDAFPGAEIQNPVPSMPKEFWERGGDDIPW